MVITAASALRWLQVSGADGELPPPRPAERLQLAAEQQELVTTRGDLGLLIARNPMGWTGTGFPGAPQLRHALIRAPTPPDALALLDTAAAQLG